jgi:hypothetical protein
MSVEDLEKVDLVSLGPDGRWFLMISDQLDWTDSRNHQYKLQKKLNAYMKFIESGQMVTSYPAAKGAELVLDVRFMHMPDEDGWKFLERVRNVVERAGVQLQCKMLNSSLN